MEYDFSMLHVHSQQVKLLKKLKHRGPQMSAEMDVSALFDDNLIQPSRRCRDLQIKEITISEKGELYLQWRREDMFRHRWPVYMSIASFVVSLASLALSIVALCS